jgi:predicted aspartyl protease
MSYTKSAEGSALRCARVATAAMLALMVLVPTAEAACKYRRTASIPMTWKGGLPHIEGSINGTPVEMIVDTGTSGILIPGGLADQLNLPQRRNDTVWIGTGGRAQGYDAHVEDVAFGPVHWHNTTLPVAALKDSKAIQVGGTFLLQTDLEMSADGLKFFEASDCGDATLAYWADGVPFTTTEDWGNERRIVVTVKIDGKPVRALIDSGAPTSRIDIVTARELGFDEHGANVTAVPSRDASKPPSAWVATFDTFAIDEETVHHPHLVVTDLWGKLRKVSRGIDEANQLSDQAPLMLGADFLKSHRVLFARSQHRMYLSYVGGPLFSAPTQAAAQSAADAPEPR